MIMTAIRTTMMRIRGRVDMREEAVPSATAATMGPKKAFSM